MISVFDLFKIGIGPSSSHTVGPMKAAAAFVADLERRALSDRLARVQAVLYGSLAWTGRGHGTDRAVILGLTGEQPETVDPSQAQRVLGDAATAGRLSVAGRRIAFDPATDLVFDQLGAAPVHPNTLAFTALDAAGDVLLYQRWCSIGGGFVAPEAEVNLPRVDAVEVPYPFGSAAELLARCETAGLTVAQLVFANECALRPAEAVDSHLLRICAAMMACIDRGLRTEGELPGGLHVRRRAPALLAKLEAAKRDNVRGPHETMDQVSLFAIAVNEENAAGGRVVTAPTNGAAGVIPAVLRHHREQRPGSADADARVFLLTAAAIGMLCKANASISGAEVGCQGEVGVACAMAAAGLAAVLGGSNRQIENAAEIAMEHHLGMTCDPVGGLVQIPCIERNAFGAVKAINAASLALNGDGVHHISLDKVIETMRQTGADMDSRYKETSRGGLAVSHAEC